MSHGKILYFLLYTVDDFCITSVPPRLCLLLFNISRKCMLTKDIEIEFELGLTSSWNVKLLFLDTSRTIKKSLYLDFSGNILSFDG